MEKTVLTPSGNNLPTLVETRDYPEKR